VGQAWSGGWHIPLTQALCCCGALQAPGMTGDHMYVQLAWLVQGQVSVRTGVTRSADFAGGKAVITG
jgi:hypothetical protein